MTRERDRLKAIWMEEEKRAEKVNSFSYIDGRWDSDELPWNYRDIIYRYLKKTDRLLDLDTGNGEFLLSLDHPFLLTGINEDYLPNYELCKSELEPLGITVKKSLKSQELPYQDGIFDVVHNRNGFFDPDEVARVLKTGGYFITQQLGGMNDYSLAKLLLEDYRPSCPGYNLEMGRELLKDDFELVESGEGFIDVRFYDVATIIAFIKIARKDFPNFSVEDNLEGLLELQTILDRDGYVSTSQHRFMMVAKKIS